MSNNLLTSPESVLFGDIEKQNLPLGLQKNLVLLIKIIIINVESTPSLYQQILN